MKNFISILVLCFFPFLINGQIIKKDSSESYEEFALRNKPKNSEKISFIKVDNWNSKEEIFVFYEDKYKDEKITDSNQIYTRLIGVLYSKKADNEYNKRLIDTIHNEGGVPRIKDLFFANADNDKKDELILITVWDQRHYQISGKLYGTFIYDNLKTPNRDQLVFLKKISQIVDGGFEGNREGKIVKSKYKNRDEIISKLKELTN